MCTICYCHQINMRENINKIFSEYMKFLWNYLTSYQQSASSGYWQFSATEYYIKAKLGVQGPPFCSGLWWGSKLFHPWGKHAFVLKIPFSNTFFLLSIFPLMINTCILGDHTGGKLTLAEAMAWCHKQSLPKPKLMKIWTTISSHQITMT